MKLTKLLKKFLCFGAAAAISLGMMPAAAASAAGGYPDVDMFAYVNAQNGDYAIKGVQGAGMDHDINQYTYTDSTGTHGISHSFWNAYLDEMIFRNPVAGAEEYTFEGKTYYFNFLPIESFVQMCNSQMITCNIQFMLHWDGSADKAWLVDPGARQYPNPKKPGMNYYALDTEGEGRQAFRAFWKALMQWCAARGYHIDQFILGNEVNAPNTWYYYGSVDVNYCTTKYALSFLDMYRAVREYSSVSRCSICVDHTWTHNDLGNAISTKDFLDSFYKKIIAQNGSDVDWCISTHIWPAEMHKPSLTWTGRFPLPNFCNQNVNKSLLWDASNLNMVTDYIKNNFGAYHRIMMTEQGFVVDEGEGVQAASLAYAYYACLYNDMVDQFILHDADGDNMLAALRPTAQEVYKRIGSPDAADKQRISDVCLPVMGKTSWSFIPNYGLTQSVTPVTPAPATPATPATPAAPAAPAAPSAVDFNQMKASFDEHYYADTYPDLKAAFGYNREALWNHYVTSGYSEGRVMKNPAGTTTPATPAAPTTPSTSVVSSNGQLYKIFDEHYYADKNPDLKAAFGYDRAALWNHFVTCGLNEGRVMNSKLDVVKYKNTYSDLSAAFGNNWDAYVEHYLTSGINEGRDSGIVK